MALTWFLPIPHPLDARQAIQPYWMLSLSYLFSSHKFKRTRGYTEDCHSTFIVSPVLRELVTVAVDDAWAVNRRFRFKATS